VFAIAVATPGGIGSLTIRLLAQHLGVKPRAIRARLLTDTELSYASDLGSLPKLNCRIPCMSPHAATQPPLVIASGAVSGIRGSRYLSSAAHPAGSLPESTSRRKSGRRSGCAS
jgi:hypothetical protein